MFKKFITRFLLVSTLLFRFSFPTFATTIDLYIDSHRVPTESYATLGTGGDTPGKYYMDVLPEVKNGITYVPISTLIKFLGATITWQDPTVTITYGSTNLVLTIDSSEAVQNGEDIQLDATPYISNNRTMVPLRFISEAFGCLVDYSNHQVSIYFPALRVNQIPVTHAETEFHMTMGSVISETRTNLCIRRLYEHFTAYLTKEIPTPVAYGNHIDLDSPEFCYELKEYRFLDTSNNVIAHYKVYTKWTYGMGDGVYVLEDVLNDKWYSFSEDAYYNLIDLENMGTWTETSNTVV